MRLDAILLQLETKIQKNILKNISDTRKEHETRSKEAYLRDRIIQIAFYRFTVKIR